MNQSNFLWAIKTNTFHVLVLASSIVLITSSFSVNWFIDVMHGSSTKLYEVILVILDIWPKVLFVMDQLHHLRACRYIFFNKMIDCSLHLWQIGCKMVQYICEVKSKINHFERVQFLHFYYILREKILMRLWCFILRFNIFFSNAFTKPQKTADGWHINLRFLL